MDLFDNSFQQRKLLGVQNTTENDLPYHQDKYNDNLRRYIIASGILDDVDNNPQIASSIGGRIQSDMLQRANTKSISLERRSNGQPLRLITS